MWSVRSCQFLICAFLIPGQILIQGQDSKKSALQVTPVEDSATVITSKGLKSNPAVASASSGSQIMVAQGFPANPGGPLEGARYQEKVDKTEQPNGTEVYGFLLQPGERIIISKSGDSPSKVAMRISEPLTMNKMTPLVQRANRAARPVRCRRMDLQNVLSEPFHMILLLYGEVGYAYELKIDRSRK